MDRRGFLTASGAGLAALAIERRAVGASPARSETALLPDAWPQQDRALVAEIVGAAHFDLERVRKLLDARPELAKAAWDWGFGDWESALGAASHTGRREIAELLLAHGARPTIFSAAMLGQLQVVRAFVDADAAYATIEGPHSIPLIEHARAGGERAATVVEYLESINEQRGEDTAARGQPLAPYFGTYVSNSARHGTIVIDEHRNRLRIKIGDTAARPLLQVAGEDPHVFRPAGSSAPRVRFRLEGQDVTGLTIRDGENVVHATRR